MGNRATYRQKVYEFCQEKNGLITTKEAVEIGVPAVELRKLAARNALERIGYGLYRAPYFPFSKESFTLEALAAVGEGAFVTDESVLSILEIGLFNPRKLHIATVHRVRKQLPKNIVIHKIPNELVKTSVYKNIKCKAVDQVFKDLVGRVMSERLMDAAVEAKEMDYLTNKDFLNLSKSVKTVKEFVAA